MSEFSCAVPEAKIVAGFDPIRFEVIRNAITAAVDEMGAALQRSAYSTNIKTRADFSCMFFNRELRAVAQTFTQPIHLGGLFHLVPAVIQHYGAHRLAPGDAISEQSSLPGRRTHQ